MPKLAAIDAPVPPLEPPGVRVRSYGFLVCPPTELTELPPRASSVMFALARISAPASRSLLTTNASCSGTDCASVSEPPVVGMSAVSKLSLRMTGIQSRGRSVPPLPRNSRSISAAVSSALLLIVIFVLGGAAVGGALGCLANNDDYGAYCGGQDDTKVIVGAALGGIAGAAAGALLFKKESWQTVTLSP